MITTKEVCWGAGAATALALALSLGTAVVTGGALGGAVVATLPIAAGSGVAVGAVAGGRRVVRSSRQFAARKGWVRLDQMISEEQAVANNASWMGAVGSSPMRPISDLRKTRFPRTQAQDVTTLNIRRLSQTEPQTLAKAASYIEQIEGPKSPRGGVLSLLSVSPLVELRDGLVDYYCAVEHWQMHEDQFSPTTLVSGRHIIEILSEHCRRMAADRALHRDQVASDTLQASLKARTLQLRQDVDEAEDENRRAFMGNMDDLAEHLEDCLPQIERVS